MTLTALNIANFKAFAASQRVPLRPITLIYGANSAGKSSILHALALAHHAIESGELDTQRTRIGGESIDLGGFRQYVHHRERERQVELGFELDPSRLSGRLAELLGSARNVVVEVAVGLGRSTEWFVDLIGMEPPPETLRLLPVLVERFSVAADGAPLLTMSVRKPRVLQLDRLDHAHPVFREVFRGLVMFATTTGEVREEDFNDLGEVLDDLVPGITARCSGLFPRIDNEPEGGKAEGEGREAFVPVSRGRRREDLARAARLFLPKAIRDLVDGLGATLESEIRRLSYLGPLRSYPPRHLAFSQDQDPNWFAGGGYAWDVVRTDEDTRRRVNKWLGDENRLKTPYELVVRELLPASAVASELPRKVDKAAHDLTATILGWLGDGDSDLVELSERLSSELLEVLEPDDPESMDPEIHNAVSSIVDSEELCERWIEEIVLDRAETLQDLMLIDKRTSTVVSHRDVGIGVSQVLPVLVSAFASKEKILAIEQPEIHLHPALQAELGDVFLESALGNGGNTCLIETHSEHLLLRIMRRMRETSTGELPEGVPKVRPEDVMVLFVEPDGSRSIIREMPLNERGELVKAWPGGFFEEGLREVF